MHERNEQQVMVGLGRTDCVGVSKSTYYFGSCRCSKRAGWGGIMVRGCYYLSVCSQPITSLVSAERNDVNTQDHKCTPSPKCRGDAPSTLSHLWLRTAGPYKLQSTQTLRLVTQSQVSLALFRLPAQFSFLAGQQKNTWNAIFTNRIQTTFGDGLKYDSNWISTNASQSGCSGRSYRISKRVIVSTTFKVMYFSCLV